ncbi:MAG: hypothetical protein AAF918_08605 [Pseudomonadota bacterium]
MKDASSQTAPDAQLLRLRNVMARVLKVSAEELEKSVRTATADDMRAVALMRVGDGATEQAIAEDSDYLHWRYLQCPIPGTHMVVVDLKNGPVAAIGVETAQFRAKVKDQSEAFARLMDAVVAPEHQSHGLGAWLTLEVLNRFSTVIVIGSNEQSRSISEKLFTRLEIQRLYKSVLESKTVVERRLGRNLLSYAVSELVDWWNRKRIHRQTNQLPPQYTIAHFQTIDRLLSALPDDLSGYSLGPTDCWEPLRTPSYLAWRFGSHPGRRFSAVAILDSSDHVQAYAVYTVNSSGGDRAGQDAYIVDWRSKNIAEGEDNPLSYAITGALSTLSRQRVSVVTALVSDAESAHSFQQAGFVLRAHDPRFYLRTQPTNASTVSSKGFAITYADTDRIDYATSVCGETNGRAR